MKRPMGRSPSEGLLLLGLPGVGHEGGPQGPEPFRRLGHEEAGGEDEVAPPPLPGKPEGGEEAEGGLADPRGGEHREGAPLHHPRGPGPLQRPGRGAHVGREEAGPVGEGLLLGEKPGQRPSQGGFAGSGWQRAQASPAARRSLSTSPPQFGQ